MGNCTAAKKSKPKVKKVIEEEKNVDNVKIALKSLTIKEDFKTYYEIIKTIGHGHFGIVRSAYAKDNKAQKYAIKTLPKHLLKDHLYIIKREIEVLKYVDHPNIIKFYNTFEDDKYFHLVMELCEGGELFERISSKQHFSEIQVVRIIKQIISAINHLHSDNIVHRDIKPENFLFQSRDERSEIKIIDFGLCRKISKSDSLNYLTSIVGTPHYAAPEVLRGKYGKECDMWSIGVVLYILLSGSFPFNGENEVTIVKKIQNCNYSFLGTEWRSISDDAKDLIQRLLCADPKLRYTAQQALEHKWLNIDEESMGESSRIRPSIFSNLQKFTSTRKFKRQALSVLVKFLNDKDINDLKKAFNSIDYHHQGTISCEELQVALTKVNLTMTNEEIQSIMATLVRNGESNIKYSDFIAATMDKKLYMNTTSLKCIFKYFDQHNTNYVTRVGLIEGLKVAGKEFSENDISDMMKEAGCDDAIEGKIDFDAFCKMMRSESEDNKIPSLSMEKTSC